jgi:hypothetical protein
MAGVAPIGVMTETVAIGGWSTHTVSCQPDPNGTGYHKLLGFERVYLYTVIPAETKLCAARQAIQFNNMTLLFKRNNYDSARIHPLIQIL